MYKPEASQLSVCYVLTTLGLIHWGTKKETGDQKQREAVFKAKYIVILKQWNVPYIASMTEDYSFDSSSLRHVLSNKSSDYGVITLDAALLLSLESVWCL